MNNEIEQIAQQNDMSIEFVRWFFNEKKAACGEHWFLALGAMWEGWKAREGEATALALTLEKSREASGCPADVDLQDWVKRLAADNLAMRETIEAVRGVADNSSGIAGWHLNGEIAKWSEILPEIDDIETPATNRIVAGIKADGVEEMASTYRGFANKDGCSVNMKCSYNLTAERAESYAAYIRHQVREGADK